VVPKIALSGWIVKFFLVLRLFPLFGLVSPLAAQDDVEPAWNVRHDIYLTLEDALKAVFPDADEVLTETIRLGDESRQRVAQAVGHPLLEESFTVYRGLTSGRTVGYAIVGEELGKFRPITSIVMVGADGIVKDVHVMVYRESRGEEVKRRRFLHQYEHKGAEDPIRINRDINGISGATISVRSMNAQVRKVIHVIREAYFLDDE